MKQRCLVSVLLVACLFEPAISSREIHRNYRQGLHVVKIHLPYRWMQDHQRAPKLSLILQLRPPSCSQSFFTTMSGAVVGSKTTRAASSVLSEEVARQHNPWNV